MKRILIGKLISINSAWLGLSFMWNSLHVILIPALLLNFVSDHQKNTVLGLLTGIGLIIAMLVQPLAGAVSDRWISTWGRRRPLMIFGTLFDVVFLLLIGMAGDLPILVIGYIGLQFSSNIAHGALQGLLPDLLQDDQLGRGSAFKTVIDMLAVVIASLLMGRIVDPISPQGIFPVLMIILFLVGSTSITVLLSKEVSTKIQGLKRISPLKINLHQFDLRKSPTYTRLILGRLVFLLGVFGIQAFAQYFVRDKLQVENPVQLTGDLMASIVLGLIAFSLIAGWMSDRISNPMVHRLAAFLVCVGALLMILAKDATTVLILGLIVGAGIGLFLTANWALANLLAPREEAGKYLGLTNLATAGGGAISRLFGPVIDAANQARPGYFDGYTLLFSFSAFCALISLWILNAHDPRKSNSKAMVDGRTDD